MNLKSALEKIKRVYKLFIGAVLVVFLALVSLYIGINELLSLSNEVSDVEVYYRFNLAMIPIAGALTSLFVAAVYFVVKETRLDDVSGNTVSYSIMISFILSVLVTLITPSIYESRFENSGLKVCSGTPVGYLPFFAKKYAIDPSLCKK
ncbi:hypothetical protein AB4516_19035 [Vibrio sp. 10N.222.54.F12]|uniref:hypothetical protein n=1 Tax=Vibrio TaxID=662 RepID=UPI00036A2CD1|nr:hypothetical protein [Vibrio tasmaniensis]OEF70171.1 hypothetical protein A152_17170 [Vibrio tasmaniensis 1F-187]PML13525.1 hypothetical protein BCT83_18870 [Vibrio tasmaniensis]